MNILLVWPRTPPTFWSFQHVLPFISKKSAFPPLGLLTVAALLPRDWSLKLVDLNCGPLTDADLAWADYVMLSGMIVHADSARQIIDRCLKCGKILIAGGPLFTSGHERFPELQHVVLGEAEAVMPELVADLRAGTLKPLYRSDGFPDIATTPVPRWDLLNLRHYATMPLQFSRGCPFNCEFCDVIVMNGRTPRIKAPEQMIGELEALRKSGWRGGIFIVDDNFIGHKPRVKALLHALIDWRRRTGFRTTFTTEASLNLADDCELMDLMVQAGFKRVFVGIESPQAESLAECAKVQNTQRDLLAAVQKIQNAGMEVMGGFIVGFDSDRTDIFERQWDFIQKSGVATAMVGLLTALPKTRLYQRLAGEGRILAESTGNNLDGVLNFIPRLDRDVLLDGYRKLLRRLYAPRAYYARIYAFLRQYRPSGPRQTVSRDDVIAFFKSLWIIGVVNKGRREFWKFLIKTTLFHPTALAEGISLAILGYHFQRIAAVI